MDAEPTRQLVRLRGRSYLAFVFSPVVPIMEWLEDIDATLVRSRGGKVLVTDGPFAEAKEWIAGLDLLEVSGLDEAIEVAATHPMARGGLMVLSPLWPFDAADDHVARAEREAPERGVRTEPKVPR